MGPFKYIGFPSTGIDPRKKRPPALLRAFGAVRYEASKLFDPKEYRKELMPEFLQSKSR